MDYRNFKAPCSTPAAPAAKPRRAAVPAAAKHDPTWLRGNTIADDDVDVVDDVDGEDGGDDADAENAARKHGRWWSCHAMLCYVMFIFKINFQNKIFKIERSKSNFQNRSFRTVIFRIILFPKVCIFRFIYDVLRCLFMFFIQW